MIRSLFHKRVNLKSYPDIIFSQDIDIKFSNNLVFLVGENGSGKSTLLESLALKTNLPTVGSSSTSQDTTLSVLNDFSENLKISWDKVNHKGFFLRAEDFFGFTKYLHHLETELKQLKQEYSQRFTGYGKDLAMASMQSQINGILVRYGDLNTVSHGQGFLKLFEERLVPGGLYLLDEPEAALSPTRQLSLISLIKDSLQKDCQFIVATHSPILLSFQPAQILEFKDGRTVEIGLKSVEHINLTKSILAFPDSFFSKL